MTLYYGKITTDAGTDQEQIFFIGGMDAEKTNDDPDFDQYYLTVRPAMGEVQHMTLFTEEAMLLEEFLYASAVDIGPEDNPDLTFAGLLAFNMLEFIPVDVPGMEHLKVNPDINKQLKIKAVECLGDAFDAKLGADAPAAQAFSKLKPFILKHDFRTKPDKPA